MSIEHPEFSPERRRLLKAGMALPMVLLVPALLPAGPRAVAARTAAQSPEAVIIPSGWMPDCVS